MCSNNVCRQASPILSTVLFYSLSVLFSHPLSLSQPYALGTHTAQKFFRIHHYIHLFIMRLLLSTLYPSFVTPLVHRLALPYAVPTLARNIRKYMSATTVVSSLLLRQGFRSTRGSRSTVAPSTLVYLNQVTRLSPGPNVNPSEKLERPRRVTSQGARGTGNRWEGGHCNRASDRPAYEGGESALRERISADSHR